MPCSVVTARKKIAVSISTNSLPFVGKGNQQGFPRIGVIAVDRIVVSQRVKDGHAGEGLLNHAIHEDQGLDGEFLVALAPG